MINMDAPEYVFLSRIHFPVRSLGVGKRIGVWTQGCSIQCPGCVSRDTWASNTGQVEWSEVESCLSDLIGESDGLTVSGGEPFDQPAALHAMLIWWRRHSQDDCLVYSGYSWEHLNEFHSSIIKLIDVLITDPFDSSFPQTKPLRGSDNQRMHLLTDLAHARYDDYEETGSLDVCFENGTMWIAGIPKQGDMAKLRKRLSQMGLEVNTSEQPRGD